MLGFLTFPARLLARRRSPERLLERGRRLSANGRFGPALRDFTRAAQAGLPAASFEVGCAYLRGFGVPQSSAAALPWLNRAALGGEVEAQLMLATLALQGVIQPAAGDTLFGTAPQEAGASYREALRWAEMAAAGGSSGAQALRGFILTGGPADLRDVDQGEESYRLAAEAGSPHGQLGWAIALLRGSSPAAVREARQLLQTAAEANLPAAHCMLGIINATGLGAPADLAAAAQHYRRGAQIGHGPSQLRYGLALLNGEGVARDTFQGESWLRRAALTGETQAAAALGALYAQTSDGMPPNHAEAMIWFRRAAEAGHGGAARTLAQRFLHGVGTQADPREAIRWLRLAVANDDLYARADLAGLAQTQDASEEDRAAALALFIEVADGGDMAGAYNAGLCYACGIGTQRDDAMARTGFLRAAKQGLNDAQAAAAEMLANGRGGPPDRAGAKALFSQAAAAGHAGALFALGLLAQGACGEPVDHVTAAAFLRLAANQGHARARTMLGRDDAAQAA